MRILASGVRGGAREGRVLVGKWEGKEKCGRGKGHFERGGVIGSGFVVVSEYASPRTQPTI